MITDEEIEDFLAHHGVKGMHWGERRARSLAKRTARIQGRVDRTQRIATGKASTKDRLLGSAVTAKGAQRQLQRSANNQAKLQAKLDSGKFKTQTKILNKIGAVKLTDINFHAKGDPKAKMDRGQKLAIGFLAAYATVTIASVAAKRA